MTAPLLVPPAPPALAEPAETATRRPSRAGAFRPRRRRRAQHRAFAAGPVAAPVPFPQLVERERDVLGLMARGASNAEIAARLFLSDKTVRNYVSSIFAKLGVRDRAQAIVRAREAGLAGSGA